MLWMRAHAGRTLRTSGTGTVKRIDFAVTVGIFVVISNTVAVQIPATNTVGTIGAGRTRRPSRALRTNGTLFTIGTIGAGRTHRPSRTLWTSRTLWSYFATAIKGIEIIVAIDVFVIIGIAIAVEIPAGQAGNPL